MLDFDGIEENEIAVARRLLDGPASIEDLTGPEATRRDVMKAEGACHRLSGIGAVQFSGGVFHLSNVGLTLIWFRRNRPELLPEKFRS